MMNNETSRTISTLMHNIDQRLQHPYLMRFIDRPVIDEDKLLLVHIMLSEKDLSKKEREQYAVSTMLVQIALDTHEKVTNHDVNEDSDIKNRQLTVLAGDYYSSWYYHLLSGIKDLSMIRTLAQGIQEINENKMQLYKNEQQSIEKSMDNLRRIESTLLLKTAEHFHLPLWKGIADEYLFMKRLLNERKSIMNNEFTPLAKKISNQLARSKANWHGLKQQLLEILDGYLFHSKSRLEKLWSEEPLMHGLLDQRMRNYTKRSGLPIERYAEEG
ncbi:heptaprenyl diphosphate synthase component 1 [Alkalihalobacillus sp. AL-G]|uniref:heptaprenyl diphosphate synthase component 1 n=1 Tax=Alkalihalobacillus sp. AL-G TaxID=2926399 RepID=UPI00272D5075|nr:heptaprenyl diphosphate synthase component 1 [Alkalihalobacillus sp. AL-G]WLD91830.1 heptaprenyl diphosphate synthase component 1 [Alkalihalobacillus sp. AL-G]